jgi:rubrerythrin
MTCPILGPPQDKPSMAKTLKDLTVQEVLALAIQSEEEDGRIYADLAERIDAQFPETGKTLIAMHDEENGHRHRLIELYRQQFGEHIPLIRRQDVKGFISRKPLWVNSILTISMIRREVETMELFWFSGNDLFGIKV